MEEFGSRKTAQHDNTRTLTERKPGCVAVWRTNIRFESYNLQVVKDKLQHGCRLDRAPQPRELKKHQKLSLSVIAKQFKNFRYFSQLRTICKVPLLIIRTFLLLVVLEALMSPSLP